MFLEVFCPKLFGRNLKLLGYKKPYKSKLEVEAFDIER